MQHLLRYSCSPRIAAVQQHMNSPLAQSLGDWRCAHCPGSFWMSPGSVDSCCTAPARQRERTSAAVKQHFLHHTLRSAYSFVVAERP